MVLYNIDVKKRDLNLNIKNNIPSTESFQMLLLSKSSKYGKYCVAGIRKDTHRLCRLVSDDQRSDGAIDEQYFSGNVNVLDEIIVRNATYTPKGHQVENYLIDRRYPVEKIRSQKLPESFVEYSIQDLINHYQPIFYSERSCMPEREFHLDHSLELHFVVGMRTLIGKNYMGQDKTKAYFWCKGIPYKKFSVTDSRFYTQEQNIGNALILVSLSLEPYGGYFYKYVSGIHMLPKNFLFS